MSRINILDCTLRDGGYCNAWRFGKGNIAKIITNLIEANVEIIECGFITNKITYSEDVSKYDTFTRTKAFIPQNKGNKMFVCMINYGEYDLGAIPNRTEDTVDGIRVAFHKKNAEEAMAFCEGLKAKGYQVFVQPMVSMNYTDEEFIALIKCANKIQPYAFYIVDTFGAMKKKDLTRLFYMVEHNLQEGISIGFHSHNNLQLSYSNAQALIAIQTKRSLIIDSSIMGMGRGAGNLNTELFVEYLNETTDKNYKIDPLLNIIDEVLTGFYNENYWGYSLPNYLSAINNCHPNYALYLSEKHTLTVEGMNEIFSIFDENQKNNYNQAYIEDLYFKYMQKGQANEEHLEEIKTQLRGKEVLLIAPGKSAIEEKDKIEEYVKSHPCVVISVNFEYTDVAGDYIFVGNLRRYRELSRQGEGKLLVTSNIRGADAYATLKYSDLLNDCESVRDNSGLMLIKFLLKLGVSKILLAGIDGYSHNVEENFAEAKMGFVTKKAKLDIMNFGLEKAITEFSKEIKIEFLTGPKFLFKNNP